MKLSPNNSVLVLIDIQEKLCPAFDQPWLQKVCGQIHLLVELAKELNIPILLAEQYPKGLGPTIEPVREMLQGLDVPVIEKVSFSCCGDKQFNRLLKKYKRPNVILAGMETHVCVYLTALGLIEKGYRPLVASDAVLSRENFYHANGLSLMEAAGTVVTNTETLLFQLLTRCATPSFKKISALLKESLQLPRKG